MNDTIRIDWVAQRLVSLRFTSGIELTYLDKEGVEHQTLIRMPDENMTDQNFSTAFRFAIDKLIQQEQNQ